MDQSTYYTYKLYDAFGLLLYVGCSRNVRARMNHHKQKMSWFPRVAKTVIESHESRNSALEAEAELIRTLKPKYNIQAPSRGARMDASETLRKKEYRERMEAFAAQRSEIVRLATGIKPVTLQEIATRFNLSRQRVHQVLTQEGVTCHRSRRKKSTSRHIAVR